MNLYYFSIILSILLIQVKCQNESVPIPQYPLNEQYNASYLQSLDSNAFISEALNFIFTGSYTGNTEISDAYDNNTLSALLDGGLQILAGLILEEDPSAESQDLIRKIQRILNKLGACNGTNSVFFGEIKEYLTISNAKIAIAFLLSQNQEAILKRFQYYLDTQFLGGIKDPICKAHSLLWFNDIANFEMWALQMLDSTAKIPVGLLNANINWLGNYKLCTATSKENVTLPDGTKLPSIYGKYCRASIGFPIADVASDLPVDENFGLQIGMCYSKACNNEDIKTIVDNSIKLIGAFKASWVNDVKCDDTKDVQYSDSAIAYIVILSSIMVWVGISALYDIALRIEDHMNKPEFENYDNNGKSFSIPDDLKKFEKPSRIKLPNTLHQFLINSSLYSNAESLLRTDPKSGGLIACLNGLRVFSTIWIIWGHTYNYAADRRYFLLMDNVRDLIDLSYEAYAQLIINGMFAVDTFFLMSGLVLAFSFLKKWEKKSFRIKEWLYYYIHRYWRLIPPYLIIIVIFVEIMPYFGNGPLFTVEEFPPYKEDCHKYWYSYILFLNNFIKDGKGSSCMGYLWYIPNDFQFYMVSPLFLLLLYYVPIGGFFLIALCLGGSLFILALLSANVYVSRQKDIIMVLLDMWDDVYIKPYNRASPYLIGLLLGYIFYKNKTFKLKYIYVALGWLTSTGLALAALFGGYTNHEQGARRMETGEYAIFFSMSRLIWALSISWIIFACHYGYGGIVNKLLSSGPILSLSRMCYAAYLIHPPIMQFYYYTERAIFHGSFVNLVYLPLGHICVSFFLSFFYTLFFEIPFVAFEKLIYPNNKKH